MSRHEQQVSLTIEVPAYRITVLSCDECGAQARDRDVSEHFYLPGPATVRVEGLADDTGWIRLRDDTRDEYDDPRDFCSPQCCVEYLQRRQNQRS